MFTSSAWSLLSCDTEAGREQLVNTATAKLKKLSDSSAVISGSKLIYFHVGCSVRSLRRG